MPKRVIGSVLLLGGVAYLPALCAKAEPYVTPAREQVGLAGPTTLPANPRVLPQAGASPNTSPQILPQAAPPIPGASESKIEGVPTPAPAAPSPANDKVILPNLKGLVFIDNINELKKGGVSGSGVNTGNMTMLDDKEIRDQLDAFIGKPLTRGTVQQLGTIIAEWYRQKKYPFVDVSVPAGQDVTNGVVQVVVAESRMGKLMTRGNYWFSDHLLERNVRVQPGERINIGDLEEDKNWINQNPFRLVNIVASRGDEPGVTDLTIDTVVEKFPVRGYVGYANSGTPALGHDRWNLGFIWGNAAWNDDQFSYQFQTSDDFWHNRQEFNGQEVDPQFKSHTFNYAAALPWRDKIIVYGYLIDASSKANLGPFNPLRPTQGGEDFSMAVRYSGRLPSTRKFDEHYEVGFEFKSSGNNLVFEAIPTRPSLGQSTTEVAQFVFEYDATERDDYGQTEVSNSLVWSPGGLTGLNNTAAFINQTADPAIRDHYVYDHFVLTRVTGLPLGGDTAKALGWFGGVTAVTKFVAQVSNENLLPSEQLGAGGAASVRGYDERAANGAEGVEFSQEFRTPSFSLAKLLLKTDSPWNDQTQLGVFYDYGDVFDKTQVPFAPSSIQLSSVGMGFHLLAGPDQNVRIDLDYGFQLHKLPFANNDSQYGHVAVTIAN
jgi:hemolysin activation/secretion protein